MRTVLAILTSVCLVGGIHADPVEELQKGRSALQKGDVDVALPLLESAGKMLPESIDAQLALADCYLQMGQLTKALHHYRIVLELSPKNVRAQRVVDALVNQQATYAKKMRGVTTLMNLGAFPSSRELLLNMLNEPLTLDQRNGVRLRLAECQLWSGETTLALQDAVSVAQTSREGSESGPARVLAALAMLQQPNVVDDKLRSLIVDLGKMPETWKKRAELVELVLQSRNSQKVVGISAKLSEPLAHIPAGKYLSATRNQLASSLLERAQTAADKGDLATALDILWPMIAKAKIPDATSVLKPINLEDGWLGDEVAVYQARIARLLIASADRAFERTAKDERALHYWLAAELLRRHDSPHSETIGVIRTELVERCRNLGLAKFQRQEATLAPNANEELNQYDAIALTIDGQLSGAGKLEESKSSLAILERYVQAGSWSAASSALSRFYASQDAATLRLATLKLRLRRASGAEQALRDANRTLGAEFIPEAEEAVADLVAQLKTATPATRDQLHALAKGKIDEYARHLEDELAKRVLAACETVDPDWTLMQRIALLDDRATGNIEAQRFTAPLGLLDGHRAALAHVETLLKDHPSSPYIVEGIGRVERIATLYQRHRAYDVAEKVLSDFVEQHPKLTALPRLQFQRVGVLLAKVENELNTSIAKPDRVSPELASVVDSVIAFRAANPGELAGNAQTALFQLVAKYAAKRRWRSARGIVTRYEKSIPAKRRWRLQLMNAATLLGELDAAHGLAILRTAAELTDEINLEPPKVPAVPNVEVATHAYELLVDLLDTPHARPDWDARAQLDWLVGFFEKTNQPTRANEILQRWITDRPNDSHRMALQLRMLTNQFAEADRTRREDEAETWLANRHALFEAARQSATKFVANQAHTRDEAATARLLHATSYEREAELYAPTQPVRAGGLLVESARAVLALGNHPTTEPFVHRANRLADRLVALQQPEQAVDVLQMIAGFDPLLPEVDTAYLRIAELHAANLARPLDAVQMFQVYLQRGNDAAPARPRIFAIAKDLADRQRFLESLYCYRVFVDASPDDPAIPEALFAMGSLHQENENWDRAIALYTRIAKEYPSEAVLPKVVRALAECRLNLGDWQEARTVYQAELSVNPQAGDAALLRERLDVLDQLLRYQSLLANKEDDSGNSDALFQMGRLVWEKLNNPRRAIVEFRKVIDQYPKSALTDDARLEVGRALLAIDRVGEARQALLAVPANHAGSPLADDALFLLGESYEHEAQALARLSGDAVRNDTHIARQRQAFRAFTQQRDPVVAVLATSLPDPLQASVSLNQLVCQVCEAEAQAESESVLRVASRQDRINEAYHEAVTIYAKSANDYPLGDATDTALSRMARIYEAELKDQPKAMQAYKKIVTLFPGTPIAEDAAWKLASFFVAQKSYPEAVEAYRDFIRNHPSSSRVADAQFAVGQILERMERWVDAMDAYEIFRQKFGQHPQASKALEQINWIKTYHRK